MDNFLGMLVTLTVMSRPQKIMETEVIKNSLFKKASSAWDKGHLKKAFELFSKAAENGDSSSQANLGYFYDEGIYVQQNFKNAIYWYKKAYHQGEESAASNIAIIYKSKQEYKRALWWLHKAVFLKDHDALYEIGQLYEEGLGVKVNKVKAAYYYRQVLLSSKYVTEFIQEQARESLTKLKI